MKVDEALAAWGASKLPTTVTVYGGDYLRRTETEVAVTVDRDTVYVDFVYDEGFACCGGRNTDCYCSQATAARAEVEIRAAAYDADGGEHELYVTIPAENFDLHTIVREMVELAGTVTA